MPLNDIQEKFKDTMLDHPDAVADPDPEFARYFNEGDIPLPARLKVYRNNIVGGLTDSIIKSFPILEKLVGKDFLEGMARSYALDNPPEHGCLNTYGNTFDAFIKDFKLAEALPYLSDVAAFEIAMNESYYAPNDIPLSPEDLAGIAPDDLPETLLKPRASLNLVKSKYPLQAIKDFCMKDDRADDETLNMNQGGQTLMIYRPQIETLIITLSDAEYEMLSLLKDGNALGAAVEQTLSQFEGFDFQEFLAKHLDLVTFQSLSANT